jgi:hypothetical protein
MTLFRVQHPDLQAIPPRQHVLAIARLAKTAGGLPRPIDST